MASSELTEDEIGPHISDEGGGSKISMGEIVAQMESMQMEIEELRAEKERLEDELDELRAEDNTDEYDNDDRIEWRGDGRKIKNLWIDDVPVGNAIATRKEEIEQLEADFEEVIPEETLEDPSESIDDAWTLAEKAIAIGPEEFLDSASEKRAVTILESYSEWSSMAQAGRVICTRSDKLKKLLEAERGESLAWKQVYRACEKLEILTDGHVEWDSEQKILVLSEALPSMSTDEY